MPNYEFLGRYENKENGHFKFYEITGPKNGWFEVLYGKIGTFGKLVRYAENEAREKSEEKLKKGYKKVSGSKVSKPEEFIPAAPSRLSKVK